MAQAAFSERSQSITSSPNGSTAHGWAPGKALKSPISPSRELKADNLELPESNTSTLWQAVTELPFTIQGCFQHKEDFCRPDIAADNNFGKNESEGTKEHKYSIWLQQQRASVAQHRISCHCVTLLVKMTPSDLPINKITKIIFTQMQWLCFQCFQSM